MASNDDNTDLAHADTLWKSADALRGQVAELDACFVEGERLMGVVRERLKGVGHG